MALAANALTVFATVQAECKLAAGDQTACERLINVASDAIEKYCGRKLYRHSAAERLAPSGRNRLVLNRRPLVSVESVAIDGDAFTDYEIEDYALAYLWRDGKWQTDAPSADGLSYDEEGGGSQRTIVVTYTAGYVTPQQDDPDATPDPVVRDLPYDLEQAAIETVASMWRRRGVDRQSLAFAESNRFLGRNVGGVIPDSVLPMLEKYRVIL